MRICYHTTMHLLVVACLPPQLCLIFGTPINVLWLVPSTFCSRLWNREDYVPVATRPPMLCRKHMLLFLWEACGMETLHCNAVGITPPATLPEEEFIPEKVRKSGPAWPTQVLSHAMEVAYFKCRLNWDDFICITHSDPR